MGMILKHRCTKDRTSDITQLASSHPLALMGAPAECGLHRRSYRTAWPAEHMEPKIDGNL